MAFEEKVGLKSEVESRPLQFEKEMDTSEWTCKNIAKNKRLWANFVGW